MTRIVIHVEEGLVQAVYADGDVCIDVYDLDTTECTDDGECVADRLRDEMEDAIKQEGWRCVW